MFLFDTNIFLEILMEQTESAACQAVLKQIDEDRRGWYTSFSLHAIESILESRNKRKTLHQLFNLLTTDPFLSRYETSLEEEQEISQLADSLPLDFDDTLQYYVARKKKLTLVTLDQDFVGLKELSILSPKDLVGS